MARTRRVVRTSASALRLMESMPCSTRNAAKSGKSLGACPQMPTLRPAACAASMRCAHDHLTASLRSSKSGATVVESRSTPSVSCVRSFDPIEKPSKNFGEPLGEEDVRGDLGHDVDLEPVLAAHEPSLLHRLEHALALLGRAAEGDHQLEVGQAEDLAHALDGRALEQEPLLVVGMVVAARAPPAEHRVLLARLEARAADQARVFVGLEVAEAKDDGPRVERGGDRADALREAIDEVRGLVGVSRGSRRPRAGPRRQGRIARQRQRVHAHPARKDELHPGEAHAFARQQRVPERGLRVPGVEQDLRSRLGSVAGSISSTSKGTRPGRRVPSPPRRTTV